MKAPANIKTVAQYLASLPEPRRADLTALDKAIREAVPALRSFIAYGMIGYGSGRAGETPVIGLASQKQHMSLYMCGGDEGEYLPEQNRERLGKVSVGKGCIRFKRLEDLNLPVAIELVKKAAATTLK